MDYNGRKDNYLSRTILLFTIKFYRIHQAFTTTSITIPYPHLRTTDKRTLKNINSRLTLYQSKRNNKRVKC